NKEGKLSSPVIRKSLGMGLDDEVIRILSLPSVPGWIPGEKEGEPVNMVMTIPVRFKSDQVTDFKPFFQTPSTSALTASDTLHGEPVFHVVQKMPVPAGGMEGWNDYLGNNLTYPEAAKKAGIEGIVYLAFIIDREGNIVDPFILRGIGGGADEEALRLVRNAPAWTPGMQREEKVNVKMRLPIRFKLPPDSKNGRSSLSNHRDIKASGKPLAGTLETVYVRGYGPNRDYELNTSGKNIIEISLADENNMLINGKKVQWEDLKQEISNEAERLAANNLEKDQIVASIRANEKTKMERIQDIQTILVSLGIRKVSYSNFR